LRQAKDHWISIINASVCTSPWGRMKPYCMRNSFAKIGCFSFPSGSRPRSRCFPRVLHLFVVHCWCATGTGSTRRTRSVLCLPAQTLDALVAMWVIRAHTSHLAATSNTQHSPDRFIRHAVIKRDVTQRFSLLDTLEHGAPCRGRDLPARIRYSLRVARQRQKQRIVKGRCRRIISW
jgi:hypothetical protein